MEIDDNKKKYVVDGNELIEDIANNKYYICFKNYNGEQITSEIPKEVFDIYMESKKVYYKNENEKKRHWERLKLTDETLYKRSYKHPKSIEDMLLEKEKKHNLHIAISNLPEIQRKRIRLKYFNEMKERELAEKEHISLRAIQYSLKIGIDNLKKLKKFFK